MFLVILGLLEEPEEPLLLLDVDLEPLEREREPEREREREPPRRLASTATDTSKKIQTSTANLRTFIVLEQTTELFLSKTVLNLMSTASKKLTSNNSCQEHPQLNFVCIQCVHLTYMYNI